MPYGNHGRTLIGHLVDCRAGQDVKPGVPSGGLGRVAFRGRGEPARMLPRRRGGLAGGLLDIVRIACVLVVVQHRPIQHEIAALVFHVATVLQPLVKAALFEVRFLHVPSPVPPLQQRALVQRGGGFVQLQGVRQLFLDVSYRKYMHWI